MLEEGGVLAGEYLFKHALIHDAAYGTLLRDSRRALHARIVEALEAQTPDIAATRPEALAHHYVEAGQIERGARLWGEAGNLAFARSAFVEAEMMLRRAVILLAKLPSTPTIRKDEIEFQIALMNTLNVLKGYNSVTAKEALERAQNLMRQAESLGDTLENPLALYAILYRIYMRYWAGFDGSQTLAVSQEFVALAEQSNSFGMSATGRGLLGLAQLDTGLLESGSTLLRSAIDDLGTLGPNAYVGLFNYDNYTWYSLCLCRSYYLLGYQEKSFLQIERTMNSARASNHLATVLIQGCLVLNWSRGF